MFETSLPDSCAGRQDHAIKVTRGLFANLIYIGQLRPRRQCRRYVYRMSWDETDWVIMFKLREQSDQVLVVSMFPEHALDEGGRTTNEAKVCPEHLRGIRKWFRHHIETLMIQGNELIEE